MENTTSSYVVLAECNGKHYETWYNFIKYEGNEEALNNLKAQLEKVEFYIIDDLSTFDLDLDNKVSSETAKQMTKIDVNSVMAHRKFDGVLKTVDLGFRSKYSNDKKIVKTFDKLGIGMISNFVDGEDFDEMVDDNKEEEGSSSDYQDSDGESDYEYDISSDSSEGEKQIQEEKLSRQNRQRAKLVEKLKRMKGLGGNK